MKILMLAPEPFFQPRGTPISVYQRIKALSALGHEVDLATAAAYFPKDVIMGNINPAVLQTGTPEEVYELTRKVIEKGGNQCLIKSLQCFSGKGIPPVTADTPDSTPGLKRPVE